SLYLWRGWGVHVPEAVGPVVAESSFDLRRTLQIAGAHHAQDWQRAAANRYRRAQQMPPAILLQIRPVDQDDGLTAAHQPAPHPPIDIYARIRHAVAVAEQPTAPGVVRECARLPAESGPDPSEAHASASTTHRSVRAR